MTVWEEAGQLVTGRYRLLRRLGSGGSAQVWAARDEALGREVALKSLCSVSRQGGRERERLEREARLLAALQHPRITAVYDFAETDEPDDGARGHPFLVTELLDGESLSTRLERGPLSPAEARTVCAQVAEALAAAHGSGVVHRDVKPGNVMLTSRGAVLLDFGISRHESDVDLTGKLVLGTPACMAPEQWRGSGACPASDVYGLGCLIYWCLSGHVPFPQRELSALGLAHLLADPPALPLNGPEATEFDAVYQACVRKDPDERPSAREVADALGRRAELPTISMPPTRRRAKFAASVVAASAVLAASVVLPLTRQIDASPTPSTASTTQTSRTTAVTATTGAASAGGTRAPSSAAAPVAFTTAATRGGGNGDGQPPGHTQGPGPGPGQGPGHGHGKRKGP
ncbi:MAG TPA: serine/threonine-protein kinase [Actinospica sp.]|nr:serine/threonine-protein kinase [Actinospica sp.]